MTVCARFMIDPVRTHCTAALGNATIDYHFAVNTRAVGLQHKLTGFQGDVVGSFNDHGFDSPDIPAPGSGFVFKPATVRVLNHVAVLRV